MLIYDIKEVGDGFIQATIEHDDGSLIVTTFTCSEALLNYIHEDAIYGSDFARPLAGGSNRQVLRH